tara:strand:- start:637 stop:1095 length:459 start_codon:yes stop_codon:yes gene_type:complete
MSDISNYTPEELANASASDLEQLLNDMDVDDDVQKYFSAFDQSQIEDIIKVFENKMGQLNLSSKSKVLGFKNKLAESKEGQRQFQAKSGFANMGNPLMMQQQSMYDSMKLDQEGMGLQQQGLMLDKDRAKKSAYEEYETKFYERLGLIESMQ